MILTYPPLVKYGSIAEYQTHYNSRYCSSSITTHDGILVRFRKTTFGHAFYESSKRDGVKDKFSPARAERINWIRAALRDSSAEMYIGWNSKRKRHDKRRRVVFVKGDYVVIIRISGANKAEFVTAFVVDSATTLTKIKNSPKWV